jgi:hypothetical protein
MGGAVIRTHNRQIVHKVVVDERVLDKIAEALGIPAADRGQLIPATESIQIYRGVLPTPRASPTGEDTP